MPRLGDCMHPSNRRYGGPVKYRFAAVLPGFTLFSVLWLVTFRSFEWVPWVEYLYANLWQGLGRHLLETDPWGSLSALHIQPPGLMSVKALNLAVTPEGHQFLAATFFVFGALSVALVVDSLSLWGIGTRWAAFVGVLYALLPSTVLYTLFPFSTTPSIFACSLAIWGAVLLKRSPATGAIASSLGVFLLYAFRTSFTWVFVVFWLAALLLLAIRSSRSRTSRAVAIGGVAAVGAAVLGIQIHYITSFGVWTTTSWTGENIVKALAQSGNMRVSDKAIEAADRLGECEGSLARDVAGGNAPSWLPEHVLALPGCGTLRQDSQTGVEALDSPFKDGVYDGQRAGNFNWSQRLIISQVFSRVALEIVKADPMQLVAMATTGGVSGSRDSGISIYLGPSDDHGWITGIREVYPNKMVGGLLALAFAPAAMTLIVVGFILAVTRRDGRKLLSSGAYWLALGLVVYHFSVSNLFEYEENNRFQAEVAPALMFLSTLSLWAIFAGKSFAAKDPQPSRQGSFRNVDSGTGPT